MQLTSRGGMVTGKTSVRSTATLGWRKRDCGGRPEITSTFDFDVQGTVDGDTLELEFNLASPPSKDCPCKPHVCEVAAQQVSVKSQELRVTADGNHLVGKGLLLSRQ